MRSIALTKGYVALVDDEDYEALAAHKWSARTSRGGNPYAVRRLKVTEGRGLVYMHREIAGHPEGLVDHENRNTLDNQRVNLRVASHTTNAANQRGRVGSSRFKGVQWHPGTSKWMARLGVGRKTLYLGVFTSEEDAARAYDRAALEHFGEFARTNLGRAA